MKKKSGRKWIENNRYVMIFSVCVAIVIWIVVAMTVGRADYTDTIDNIPVDISMQDEAFSRLGFNPIEVSAETVSAQVKGDRVAVSALKANPGALTATVQLPTEMTEAGNYSLKLVTAENSIDRGLITNITYVPGSVQVKFDRLVSETFEIAAILNGLSVAPDSIQGEPGISPSQVTVRGPQVELDKIARCVVTAELTEPLEKTYVADLPIEFLDDRGDVIDLDAHHMTVDHTETRLVIEMLKIMGIDLNVGFLNVPRNFPLEELRYVMTTEHLEVGVPTDLTGKVTDINIGYIDIRTINLSSTSYTFQLEDQLPSSYVNVEKIDEITVKFDSSSWDETHFTAKGIELLNVQGFDAKILGGDTLSNISFVGRRTVLDEMTAEDIVMEIDLAEREIMVGQFQLPVKISVPTRGLVWATGEYSVIVQITETQ